MNKKDKQWFTKHYTENQRKLTCSLIDIAELIWVGVKRQSINQSLSHSLTHSIIKIDTMTLLVHNFTPTEAEDIDLQHTIIQYNIQEKKLRFNRKFNSKWKSIIHHRLNIWF
jgi:hypothetical protein